jgi:hypothetical protein
MKMIMKVKVKIKKKANEIMYEKKRIEKKMILNLKKIIHLKILLMIYIMINDEFLIF